MEGSINSPLRTLAGSSDARADWPQQIPRTSAPSVSLNLARKRNFHNKRAHLRGWEPCKCYVRTHNALLKQRVCHVCPVCRCCSRYLRPRATAQIGQTGISPSSIYPASSIKRLLQRPIHCCLHIEPETKHLRVCKRQHLRADNPRHALLSIAPPPQIWQSCPHGRVRRPPCRPAGEHKRQSPALLLSWRAGIEVGDGVGEPRLRIRDALFAELGDLGDLILKHLLDRARFQDLGTRRGRGAIVQQGCEDLFASPWLIFRTQPVLKEPESRDTYERTLAAWRNTPRRRC